jgi:hypothetical protein
MLVSALIERVSRYLTDFDSTDPDYQYVQWSKQDLLDYLRTAIVSLMAYDDSAFNCRVEVPLTGTQLVGIPQECEDFINLVGYLGPDGAFKNNVLLRRTSKTTLYANRPVCTPTRASTGSFSVTYDDDQPTYLQIAPPQSSGKLLLTCACQPTLDSDDGDVQLPTKYEGVLFNWMVSLAFGVDTESSRMMGRSDVHWNRGIELLMQINPAAKIARRVVTNG